MVKERILHLDDSVHNSINSYVLPTYKMRLFDHIFWLPPLSIYNRFSANFIVELTASDSLKQLCFRS